jgi:hypothetical protein
VLTFHTYRHYWPHGYAYLTGADNARICRAPREQAVRAFESAFIWGGPRIDRTGAESLVPRQNSFISAELVLRASQAALRYSLIKPWTTCLRLIRAVTSTG